MLLQSYIVCVIPGNSDHRGYLSAGLSQNSFHKNLISLVIKSFQKLGMLFQKKYAHQLGTKDMHSLIASGTCYDALKMDLIFLFLYNTSFF